MEISLQLTINGEPNGEHTLHLLEKRPNTKPRIVEQLAHSDDIKTILADALKVMRQRGRITVLDSGLRYFSEPELTHTTTRAIHTRLASFSMGFSSTASPNFRSPAAHKAPAKTAKTASAPRRRVTVSGNGTGAARSAQSRQA